MSEMSKKMYGNAPKLERDDEDGKVKVKKSDKSEDKEATTEGGAESEGVPMMARHHMERSEMHMKHQREHHMHDHGKHGDKKEMHKRQIEEHEMMHKRHEKEMGKDKE